MSTSEPCGMQSGTIECRGDGYLWDADFDGYDPNDHSMPCPSCNTLVFLKDNKEQAESVSYYSDMGGSGTGIDIWENAVKAATYWNADGVKDALLVIGKVEALFEETKGGQSNDMVRVFLYTGKVDTCFDKPMVHC